jgi:hypothetical protein
MYFDSEEFTLNEDFENDAYSGEQYEDNIDCEEDGDYDDFVLKDDTVIDYDQIEREIQMYEKIDKICWDMQQRDDPNTILRQQLMSHLGGLLDENSPSIPNHYLKDIYNLFLKNILYEPTDSVTDYYFNLYYKNPYNGHIDETGEVLNESVENFVLLAERYEKKHFYLLAFKYYAKALHSDLDCNKKLKVMLKTVPDATLEIIYQNYSNDPYILKTIYNLLDDTRKVNAMIDFSLNYVPYELYEKIKRKCAQSGLLEYQAITCWNTKKLREYILTMGDEIVLTTLLTLPEIDVNLINISYFTRHQSGLSILQLYTHHNTIKDKYLPLVGRLQLCSEDSVLNWIPNDLMNQIIVTMLTV